MKKYKEELKGIKCDCGYFNQEENLKKYGTCRGCGKVLDQKAKFDYEMFCKLRLWKRKGNTKQQSRYGSKKYSEL